MRVRWLRTALKNPDDEAAFIATDDPHAARTVVARVVQAVELLGGQPALGRPGRVPGTRELVIPGNHTWCLTACVRTPGKCSGCSTPRDVYRIVGSVPGTGWVWPPK